MLKVKNNLIPIPNKLYDELQKLECYPDHEDVYEYTPFALFGTMCISGNLEGAEWFYENVDHNDFCYNNYIFQKVCKKGYLEIAKWLYDIFKDNKNEPIDPHDNKEYAFRKACEHGHLYLAKWLWGLGGVDIRENNDDAFFSAAINNQINVCEWLRTICKDYVFDIEEGKIVRFDVMDYMLICQKEEDYVKKLKMLNIKNYYSLNSTCSICKVDNMDNIILLPCVHSFCLDCLLKWERLHKAHKCCLCQKSYKWNDCINICYKEPMIDNVEEIIEKGIEREDEEGESEISMLLALLFMGMIEST